MGSFHWCPFPCGSVYTGGLTGSFLTSFPSVLFASLIIQSPAVSWFGLLLLQLWGAGFTFASGYQKRGMWTSSVSGPCTAHTVPKHHPPEVRASRSQLLPRSPAPARLTGIWVDLGSCCATSRLACSQTLAHFFVSEFWLYFWPLLPLELAREESLLCLQKHAWFGT